MADRKVEISESVATLGRRKFALEKETPDSSSLELMEMFLCEEIGERVGFEVASLERGLAFGVRGREREVIDGRSEDMEFIIPAILRTS